MYIYEIRRRRRRKEKEKKKRKEGKYQTLPANNLPTPLIKQNVKHFHLSVYQFHSTIKACTLH